MDIFKAYFHALYIIVNPLARYLIFIIIVVVLMGVYVIAITFHGKAVIRDVSMDNEQTEVLVNDMDTNDDVIDGVKQYGFTHVLLRYEFWLLYIVTIVTQGIGVTYISNVSQIIESSRSTSINDNKSKTISDSLVTLISFGNFLGRIISGYLSDKYNYKYPRIYFIFYSSLFMCLSNLYLFMVSYFYYDVNIYWTYFVGSFMIGLSYGWMIAMNIATIADIFGTKYLSGNYALLDSAAIVGSIIFNNIVFAKLYTNEKNNENNINNYCYGNGCFKWQFFIYFCCGVCGTIIWTILWLSMKYNKRNKISHNKLDS